MAPARSTGDCQRLTSAAWFDSAIGRGEHVGLGLVTKGSSLDSSDGRWSAKWRHCAVVVSAWAKAVALWAGDALRARAGMRQRVAQEVGIAASRRSLST